jgi:AraC-like DNA-binding protein
MFYENLKKSYRDEPILYYCGIDENLKPGARSVPIIRDVYVIECCICGAGTIIINGNEFPFEKNSCYILMPGDTVIQTSDVIESRKCIWCAIDGFLLKNVFEQAGISSQNPFAPSEAFEEILEELKRILSMRDDTDPGVDFRRAGCIYNILGALLRSTKASNKNSVIQKAIGIMETRYHESISIEEIAKISGFDRAYFSTLFKEKTGLSPHAYLTQLRIKKASTLLILNNSTISEIALSVGLDPQNFSRFFKKETGKTPKQYIKENTLK